MKAVRVQASVEKLCALLDIHWPATDDDMHLGQDSIEHHCATSQLFCKPKYLVLDSFG